MKENKIKAYIGFAIKSRKVIFGYDKLFESKKLPTLVIACKELNEKNTIKTKEFCIKNNIKFIKLKSYLLSELVMRDNCKVLSIIDNNFAEIICKELNELNWNE